MIRPTIFLACFCCFGTLIVSGQEKEKPVYRSEAYSVYHDRVVQGGFTAVARSAEEITSDYKSPRDGCYSPDITFKFSINLRDNEMPSGRDHKVTLQPVNGHCTTTVRFGKQYVHTVKVAEGKNLKPNTLWTIRLDMREVFDAFKKQGFYTFFNGEKLFRDDFKGVYIAGNAAPLSWDFNNLHTQPGLQLTDPDHDGIFETTLVMNSQDNSKRTAASWKLSKDITSFPVYHSDYLISDALYNLAIEEMIKAVEPDSTFRTGKEWAGVWTRDISYSIILSMAYLQPQVAMYSLMRKVKNGRIIQDTGTGGAYPVSSDRMIWAAAAWEVYKATGDEDWLKQAYGIIRNSVEDDMLNIYDPETGLVRGESSFLDWREQTYPRWMQPADIFNSENLGTNAVHYQANRILAEMAQRLSDKKSTERYNHNAEKIRDGINRCLWMPEKGYYGQYLYGRNFSSLSPRAEALGEALCVLYGIADEQTGKSVIRNVPVTDYGISCIYPQIPGIPPYHNNAVWPFVQSYWALASAKAGNEKSVLESIAAVYRPAALFLTNKENFVASTGDYAGTQINSGNMLWSLSGSIALVHKVLFGIEFQPDSLVFHPFVPQALNGKRVLSGFRYRGMILDIEMEGYGNRIRSFSVDGIQSNRYIIPDSLMGRHQVEIILDGFSDDAPINKCPVAFSPEAPVLKYEHNELRWNAAENAVEYLVLKNGKAAAHTSAGAFPVEKKEYSEYQVIAVDKNKVQSFASEPVVVADTGMCNVYNPENFAGPVATRYKNYTGDGYVIISRTENLTLPVTVEIQEKGSYAVSFRYANGNGPVNTENKCAVRTLQLDGEFKGTFVFPQRGKEEWSNWGYSNAVVVLMDKGKHTLQLVFEPANENMNGEINEAAVDSLILWKTGE
ncbi:MAG TPA: trehalase family glycosidase [Bacteroidales bacterium]|nr:trehalase family glycosidase [Bacteroidales bacterium]HPT03156.1 trehalase family glycosidase [Bacteroidales bacterium]